MHVSLQDVFEIDGGIQHRFDRYKVVQIEADRATLQSCQDGTEIVLSLRLVQRAMDGLVEGYRYLGSE